jgi:hypothetical protein
MPYRHSRGFPHRCSGRLCPQVRIPSSPRKRGSIRKDGKTLKRLDSRPTLSRGQAFRGNDGKGARTTQFDVFRSPARQTGNAPLRPGQYGSERSCTESRCPGPCRSSPRFREGRLFAGMTEGELGTGARRCGRLLVQGRPEQTRSSVVFRDQRGRRPCWFRRQTSRSMRSWPKNGSPSKTIVGTPQCPAASRSR